VLFSGIELAATAFVKLAGTAVKHCVEPFVHNARQRDTPEGSSLGPSVPFMQATTDEQTPTRRNPLRPNQSDDGDAAARYRDAIKRIVDAAPPATDIPADERDTIRAILRPAANQWGSTRP
jgi:hypothetical protein